MRPLLLLLLCAAPTWSAQRDDDSRREAPAWEGALDNDAVLPVSEAAALALQRADLELEKCRAAAARGQAVETRRLLEGAFEGWREALVSGGPGAAVWFEPRSAEPGRLTEGVSAAVERRLLGLPREERELWTQRYGSSAEAALAAAGDDGLALSDVLRLHPMTPGAARAALRLSDLALEAGLAALARGWIERGAVMAELGGASELLGAFATRRSGLPPPPAPASEETWATATSCESAHVFIWLPEEKPRPALEHGVRPGLAFLSERELAIQTPEEILRLALRPDGKLERLERLRPADLLAGFMPLLEYDGPLDPPGWLLLPLVDGNGLVLVLGRATGNESNALLSLEFRQPASPQPLGLDVLDAAPIARLRWAQLGPDRVGEDLERHEVPELLELGGFEFQPGPVLAGDLVIVQAREYAGQVRAWLFAFDRRDGTLVWRRLLATGADRVVAGRFAPAMRRVASQPPLALEVDGRPSLFAGTHLGAGALLEASTGETFWNLKNRRRDPRGSGWSGDRPVLASTGEPALLWAPMDSDRVYFLRTSPLGPGRDANEALFVRPPLPLLGATALLGGGVEELVVLGSSGKERTVSARRRGEDRRDALDLGPAERFRGQGLLSPGRAWVGTDRGVYLFDRERDLYLLDSETLRAVGPGPRGGDLYARADHVLVLGTDALWSLLAR